MLCRNQSLFLSGLILFFINNLTSNLCAQVSIPSGYYNMDSLHVQINWIPQKHSIIEYRLNKFSKHDFQKYTEGLWLYDRSNQINTWENEIYTEGEDCLEPVDVNLKRGDLIKANILTVRSRDTITNEILRDSVYVFALYENPFNHPTFFITMDDEDRVELMKDLESKLKKRAWLNLFTRKGELEVSQPMEFRLAGNGSLCLANKSVQLKARSKEPIYGPKKFKTSLWGKSDKFDKIKLRSGGGGQSKAFGSNEIILKVLNSPQLEYEKRESTVGVWYLNGSYWSLTFPQTKIDKRSLSNLFGTSKSEIDILEAFPVTFFLDEKNPGCSPYLVPFPYRIDSIVSDCKNKLCVKNTLFSGDLEGWYEIPINYTKKKTLLALPYKEHKERIVGLLKNGTGIYMKQYLLAILNAFENQKAHSIEELNQLFDLDNFLKYISVVNYLDLMDAIHNNFELVATEKNIPFIVFEDFDMDLEEESNVNGNNWDFIDIGPNDCLGVLHEIFQKLIFTSPEAVERLQLVYQDLLNTIFHTERTNEIVNEIRNEVMSSYKYNFDSWGGSPNGGLRDSLDQENFYRDFKLFFKDRPDISLNMLIEKFNSESGMTVDDKKTINIIFDSIPKGIVTVSLNSLIIKGNYKGHYLPAPHLNFTYTVKEGYDVSILEFPKMDNKSLSFSLKNDQNITFILNEKLTRF